MGRYVYDTLRRALRYLQKNQNIPEGNPWSTVLNEASLGPEKFALVRTATVQAFAQEKANSASRKYHFNFYLRPVLVLILQGESPTRLQRWAWTMGAYPPEDRDPSAWWQARLS